MKRNRNRWQSKRGTRWATLDWHRRPMSDRINWVLDCWSVGKLHETRRRTFFGTRREAITAAERWVG